MNTLTMNATGNTFPILRFFDDLFKTDDADTHLADAVQEIKDGNRHGVPDAEKAIADIENEKVTADEEEAKNDDSTENPGEPSSGMDRAI